MFPPDLHAPASLPALCGIGWRHGHEAALLDARPVLPFIEVHSENYFQPGGAARQVLLQAREVYPVSLHGVGLSLGSACGLDCEHLTQLAALAELVQPLRISDHASFARVPLGGQVVHGADLLPIAFGKASLDLMVANVQQAQDVLRRPLLVENLSAYLHWQLSPEDGSLAETTFLDALCQRSGCGLLLDLNNLLVNALNRCGGNTARAQAEAQAWIDALKTPPGEIHLAGHSAQDGLIVDDHGDHVAEAVWSLYARAVRRFGAVPTLVEWDTRLPSLEVLLAEARRADAVAHAVLGDPRALVEPTHAH